VKKLHKRTGFTLIEIMLVIAIIVILSTVMFLAVTTYLSKANTLKSKVSSNAGAFSLSNNKINSIFISLGY